MKRLILEQSTRSGSLAVMEDGRSLLGRAWTEDRFHTQQMFGVLAEVLAVEVARLETLDSFGVGLGPGSYSGMRMALTAVRGLALPSEREVYGVSSAEALAWDEFHRTSADRVMVLGDARRERCWRVGYERGNGLPVRCTEWELVPQVDCFSGVPPGARWVSPDWERLAPQIGAAATRAAVDWADAVRIPTAEAVGGLIEARQRVGVASDPLEPLYLHPAVTVAPRY
jgi:tRNA threonylcarbamoyladenosine biosynthesis protein TsaB